MRRCGMFLDVLWRLLWMKEKNAIMENMSFEELQQIVSVCLDEIMKLKEENVKLREEMNNMVASEKKIIDFQKQILSNNEMMVQNSEIKFQMFSRAIENLKYELDDPKRELNNFYPDFFCIEETVADIVKNRKSMARFGDGEFAIMSNVIRQKFQRLDNRLATRLKEVLDSSEEDFLIGIADNYGALDVYNESGKAGIRYYMTEEVRKQHASFVDINRKYHNAYISRPYALFADNVTEAPRKRFDALRQIWEDREVIFVEGALTRLGVGNDLFNNSASIRRIEAPPVNSYDKYDEIFDAALRFATKDTLFLIALGPSAGVLAYDLFKAGYQAIDVGHVDLEYEWFLGGNGTRCEVKNKYNNEFPGGDIVQDIDDQEYLSQIICVIK